MSPKTLYGLPEEVKFCKKCVMSNQCPSSYPEFKHTRDRIVPTLPFGEDGVCDACRYNEQKKVVIDWEAREKELWELCDKHRRTDGGYDCIVPGSGGKDSALAAHVLKYKFGMNPLTVTWPPIMYTDYGYKNFRNWIEVGGFDNISFNQNGRAHKLLTKLAIENLLHPFQTFILGQKNLAPKIALEFGIPLIFYGEHDAEYNNPIAETATSLRSKAYYTMKNVDDLYIGGVPIKELIDRHGLRLNELSAYFPADADALGASNIEVHYLGYYIKWVPQEAYYYAVEHCGFQARPFRTQGTYSKYNSIDDKIDDLHYYTTHIKFGIGRATYDAAQEIRNKHLTREEGVALVHKYDGEFPDRYFNEVMDYIGMDPEYFHELCDKHRSPHLWEKVNGEWKLKHMVEQAEAFMLGRLSWYWKTNRLGPDMLSTYPLLFFPGCMRWVCRKKFRHFGEGAEFRPGAFATETQAISIGANVIIRQGTNIHASPYPQGSIDIEDDVLLGPGVHFYADNHVFADPARPIVDQGFDTAPVRVCKGAWLGSNVVVLAGVTIGEHAVVGAGSIVTKDVPAWTLAVGNPARVIRDIRQQAGSVILCAIPIEISARELDGVLYFALHLAERGVSTLTGDYLVNRYLEDSGQPVAYVEGDQSLTMNNRILDAGGVVLNLNPEGLGCADDPKEVLENFAKVGSAVTRICAWGERQRDIITSFLPEEQRRLVDVTGYHSFDLASPEFVPYYRDEALIRQYGDGLILMNTSFATSNHKMGFENYVRMLRRMAEWKVYDNQEFLSFLRNQHAYQTRVIDAFVELARALSVRFPERSVIIRPHPAEDRETYASRLRDLGNVTVTNEGTVRQWLACAGAVVHHDCTTGLEAFLMGRNVIQYRPFFDERYTAALLSGVGSMAETPDEVFARIRKGSMDEASVQAQRDRLSPYMATIEQGACARLADMVAGYGGQLGHWEPEPLNWIGRAKAWRKYASKLLRARQPGRNGRKVRYALEKFPRIPVEEIRRRVSGLRGVKPSLPEAEVVELALNTFLIRPAG